jgi:hypothetical protein
MSAAYSLPPPAKGAGPSSQNRVTGRVLAGSFSEIGFQLIENKPEKVTYPGLSNHFL